MVDSQIFSKYFQRGVNFLHSKPFFRNVTVLAGGTAFAQILTILASPLISRLYSPDELGMFAVYVSIYSVIVSVASWRYEVAIPLPEADKIAANLLILCTGILISSSVITGIVLWLFGEFIVSVLNAESLEPYLWLLPTIRSWTSMTCPP